MRKALRHETRSQRTATALTALGLLLAAACSQDAGDQKEFSAESEAANETSASEVDEYGLLMTEPLVDAEERALDAYFEHEQVPSEDVAFFGRLVALQGDMLVPADDLLPHVFSLGSSGGSGVEKGKVPTPLRFGSGFPDCPEATCGATLPVQYAFGTNPPGNLAFRRPDVSKTYYLTVSDAAPSFFTTTPAGSGFGSGGLMKLVADRIQTLTGDCIPSAMFQVLRDSAYNRLSTTTKESNYRIRVVTGAFSSVCGGNAVACANFPRLASVKVNGVSTERLRFGDRLAVVTQALVQPTTAIVELNAYALGIVTHELMHVIGIGHPQVSGAEEQRVPGTAAGTSHLTIMHFDTVNNSQYRDSLQSDDRAVISKLYASSCDYSNNFRLLTP